MTKKVKSMSKAKPSLAKKPRARAPRPSEIYKRLMKWADALVSRSYRQTKGVLKRVESGEVKGFCCLGVGCDIVPFGRWNSYGNFFVNKSTNHGERVAAPQKVRDYFGFTDSLGEDVTVFLSGKTIGLAGMNDEGQSFGKIAKVIRKFAELKYGLNRKKVAKQG